MKNDKSAVRQPRQLVPASILALTLALTMSAAWAESAPVQSARPAKAPAADATKPNTVGDVVVRAPPRRHRLRIPPAKAAAFAAEAARQDAWRNYRDSTPPASAGALGQAAGYPGLRSLGPRSSP